MLLYTPSTTRLGPYGQGTGLKDGEIPMCQRRFSAIRVPWALPFLLLGSLSWVTGVAAQNNDSFNQRLESSRYSLTIDNGYLAGTGASILTGALEQAQFVLVGEDHGIAEIPEFWGSICRTAVPAGFHTMAIETGPLAAAQLQEWIRQPDAETRVARFEKEHPDSIAFYNFKQELEMLQHCADHAPSADFHLWGLDQEFLGSAGWILEQVLQTHPGPQSPGRRLRPACSHSPGIAINPDPLTSQLSITSSSFLSLFRRFTSTHLCCEAIYFPTAAPPGSIVSITFRRSVRSWCAHRNSAKFLSTHEFRGAFLLVALIV